MKADLFAQTLVPFGLLLKLDQSKFGVSDLFSSKVIEEIDTFGFGLIPRLGKGRVNKRLTRFVWFGTSKLLMF